jgi:hypothetical protein
MWNYHTQPVLNVIRIKKNNYKILNIMNAKINKNVKAMVKLNLHLNNVIYVLKMNKSRNRILHQNLEWLQFIHSVDTYVLLLSLSFFYSFSVN